MKTVKVVSLLLRLVAAFIMVQSLYFKFSAQPESIYIFSAVGMEPWGRIGTGVAELIASAMLLIPATIAIGALLSAGVMLGAVFSHLFVLGIEVQGDGGLLFMYALLVLVASLIVLYLHRDQAVAWWQKLVPQKR